MVLTENTPSALAVAPADSRGLKNEWSFLFTRPLFAPLLSASSAQQPSSWQERTMTPATNAILPANVAGSASPSLSAAFTALPIDTPRLRALSSGMAADL